MAFLMAFAVKKVIFKGFWGAPIGIIAGVFSLVLSGEGFGIFHFSQNLNAYISFLLCIIFASFPICVSKFDKEILNASKDLIRYSFLQHTLQWSLGILLATFVVSYFTDNTAPYLGSILPAGFAGGHGSSAVVGSIFAKKGYAEVFSLAMLMATIGAFFSLIGGLIWIQIYKGNSDLKVNSINRSTIPRPQTFVFFGLIVLLSYLVKITLNKILFFDLPMLATGVAVGLLIRVFYKNVSSKKIEIDNFVNLTTSLLVCLGIAAIKVVVIEKYLTLVLFLSIFTLLVSVLIFKFVGVKYLKTNSFEKSLFTWGWSIGGIVFGLSLVEIVKNKSNSSLIQILGISYLMISPFEIVLILSMPSILLSKYAVNVGFCLLIVAMALLYSIIKNKDK